MGQYINAEHIRVLFFVCLFVKPTGVWSPCLSFFNLMVQAPYKKIAIQFWVKFFVVNLPG